MWIWLVLAASASDVVQLRLSVDRLASELRTLRDSTRDELRALRTERQNLERQLRLERVKLQTLERVKSERLRKTSELDVEIKAALTPGREALRSAREYVEQGLPCQLDERLAELDRVEGDLDAGDAGRAMSRLWRFLEQEDGMGGEIALSRETLDLGGQRVLVDVVRIGMALMYFRAPALHALSGQTGWLERRNGVWTAVNAEGAADDALHKLFSEVEKNRRFGLKRLVLPEGLGEG